MAQLPATDYPSLYTRIARVFIIATIIISISTLFIFRSTQKTFLEKQVQNNYQHLASVLQISSVDAIIAEDVTLLSNLLQEIGEHDPNIALLSITNDEGQEIVKWETQQAKSERLLSIHTKPIMIQGRSQGRITFLVDLSTTYKESDAFIFENELILLLLLLGLLGVQLYLVQKEAITPIEQVDQRLLEIQVGNLRQNFMVGNTKELIQLSTSLNQVSKTLHRQRIAEKEARFALEELNRAYVRFVPEAFLKRLGKSQITNVKLGDYKKSNISILFSDIRSFTTLAENMTPDETFRFINELLAKLGPVIRKHNGFIDKYIGDAIMAIFTTADDAVKAGIDMFYALEEFNQLHPDRDDIKIGIGIHSGEVILGTIGEKFRMEGTVIGDVVNLAARLESLTKNYHHSLLFSETTKEALTTFDDKNIIFIDEVLAKGKKISTKIYGIRAKRQ